MSTAKKPKSYTHRIMDAVEQSALHFAARHLLNVMARHADHETAIAWYGQARLAELTGISERKIRLLLAMLSEPSATPVRVERRARFLAGAGQANRTSDVWRLVLVDGVDDPDQPARDAAWLAATNRHGVPVASEPTGRIGRTNRHAASNQPAESVEPTGTACRGSSETDPPRSDPPRGSSEGEEIPLDSRAAIPSPPTKPRKRALTETELAKVGALEATYIMTFESCRQTRPVLTSHDKRAIQQVLEMYGWDLSNALRLIEDASVIEWRPFPTIQEMARNPSAFLREDSDWSPEASEAS